jgi:hypothetical protein
MSIIAGRAFSALSAMDLQIQLWSSARVLVNISISTMWRGKPAEREYPRWKRVAAGVFLLLFLGIHTVGVFESLHHSIHQDAAAPGHECVFHQVSKGHLIGGEQTFSSPLAPMVDEVLAEIACDGSVVLSPDHLLLPGRAPPAALG